MWISTAPTHQEDILTSKEFVSSRGAVWIVVSCTVYVNREKEERCFRPQETDNWKVTEVEVGSYDTVHECDHCNTAIWCPRQISKFRLSWVGHARCTAILVGFMMILSVHMPHGGCDEEDYITELEVVRIIMEEEKAMGAKDFLIGGDLNIELKTRRWERGF